MNCFQIVATFKIKTQRVENSKSGQVKIGNLLACHFGFVEYKSPFSESKKGQVKIGDLL